MGVQMREIIPQEAVRACSIDEFAGKIVAVDAFNAIYQFLSTIRQADGTPLMDSAGRVTSHLSGIFSRNCRLLEARVRVAYVFDGKPPAGKKETIMKREETKRAAEEKYEEALEEGDIESARKYAQATSRLTTEMVAEAKALLRSLGIPTIDAAAEGEAQAAWMCREGRADYAASQDYDSLLFGSPALVRNLGVTNKRKIPGKSLHVEVPTEIIDLRAVLSGLGITQDKLIALGILVGTDYNPGGIRGIGPKKALALLRKGSVNEAFESVSERWTAGATPGELMELFRKPAVDEKARPEFGEPDPGKAMEILCEKHQFSRERIGGTLKALEERRKEAGRQKDLSGWV